MATGVRRFQQRCGGGRREGERRTFIVKKNTFHATMLAVVLRFIHSSTFIITVDEIIV
jgi:hypothetical protein